MSGEEPKGHYVSFVLTLADWGVDDFDEEQQNNYRWGLGESLGVEEHQVEISGLAAGSVVLETNVVGLESEDAAAGMAEAVQLACDEGTLLDAESFGELSVADIAVFNDTPPSEEEKEEDSTPEVKPVEEKKVIETIKEETSADDDNDEDAAKFESKKPPPPQGPPPPPPSGPPPPPPSETPKEKVDTPVPTTETTRVQPTAAGLFPPECLVEIACGEEGEKELWMPAVVSEVVLVEKLKGANPEPAIETLGQDDGEFLELVFLNLCSLWRV